MEADAYAFYRSPSAIYAGLEEHRYPWLRSIGLLFYKTFNGAVYWFTGFSLDKTQNVPFTRFTGSSTTRLLLLLVANAAQPGSS